MTTNNLTTNSTFNNKVSTIDNPKFYSYGANSPLNNRISSLLSSNLRSRTDRTAPTYGEVGAGGCSLDGGGCDGGAGGGSGGGGLRPSAFGESRYKEKYIFCNNINLHHHQNLHLLHFHLYLSLY